MSMQPVKSGNARDQSMPAASVLDGRYKQTGERTVAGTEKERDAAHGKEMLERADITWRNQSYRLEYQYRELVQNLRLPRIGQLSNHLYLEEQE